MSDESVAEQQLPGMPEIPVTLTPYLKAAQGVGEALVMTRERLVELRQRRDEINAEVKELVAEELRLVRMQKIVEAKGETDAGQRDSAVQPRRGQPRRAAG